jgi:selenocysteine-specific elongation factor
VPVSSVTGAGIPALRAVIEGRLAELAPAPPQGAFRLPVDRVFALRGHGVVVTGTALAGEIGAGAEVRILPGDARARVRSVEVHGTPVAHAGWRQRIALNLVGADLGGLGRGDVVVDPALTLVTDRFDARIELRPAARPGLRDHARVRVHLGTAERLGKVIALDGTRLLTPDAPAYVQIAVDAPVLALRGDRFVIRSENARRTLGGGEVVLPVTERHRKRGAALVARLEVVRAGAPAAAVAEALDLARPFALAAAALAESLAFDRETVAAALAGRPADLTLADGTADVYTTPAKWSAVARSVARAVAAAHTAAPLAAGVEMEAVRMQLPYAVSPKLFRAVIERLVAAGTVTRHESILAAPDHRVALRANDEALGQRARAALTDAGVTPPDLQTLAAALAATPAQLTAILGVLASRGEIVRVGPDLYYDAAALGRARATLEDHLATHPAITAAEFRDGLGVSRKFSIALLDYFDRTGVTLRVGDTRKLRH